MVGREGYREESSFRPWPWQHFQRRLAQSIENSPNWRLPEVHPNRSSTHICHWWYWEELPREHDRSSNAYGMVWQWEQRWKNCICIFALHVLVWSSWQKHFHHGVQLRKLEAPPKLVSSPILEVVMWWHVCNSMLDGPTIIYNFHPLLHSWGCRVIQLASERGMMLLWCRLGWMKSSSTHLRPLQKSGCHNRAIFPDRVTKPEERIFYCECDMRSNRLRCFKIS